MASASVMLKEGKSYTYTDGPASYRFTQTPMAVTGRELIDKLKAISCLAVDEQEDKPVTPLKAVPKRPVARASQPPPPPPPPEPEEEPAEDDGDPEPEEPTDEGEGEALTEDEEPAEEIVEEPEPAPVPKAKGKPGPKGKKG